MKIARLFRFESAHQLPFHDGKCRHLHGHSYRLELVFSGVPRTPDPDDPQSGFVADFGRIRTHVEQALIDRYLDHRFLNESLPGLPYPSAEYVALWIMRWCMMHLDGTDCMANATIDTVRLWETETSWAEVTRDDVELLRDTPGTTGTA